MPRGYRPLKRSAKKATIVVRTSPSQRNTRMTKCGRTSSHLMSQSPRLSGSSSLPSTMTGLSFMAPSSPAAVCYSIREATEPLRKQLVQVDPSDLGSHAPAAGAWDGGARQARCDPRDEERRPRRQAQGGEEQRVGRNGDGPDPLRPRAGRPAAAERA